MDKKRTTYQDAQKEDRPNSSGNTAVVLVATGFEYMEAVMSTRLGDDYGKI